ncbi:MAG: hypothetical protein L0I76_05875 [Pseudonocardia sp.]|nr:hypothetical protein [Pseudonocardia sp.]
MNRIEPGIEVAHLDLAHHHTSRCYWDHDRCAWQCPPHSPAVPDTDPARAASEGSQPRLPHRMIDAG